MEYTMDNEIALELGRRCKQARMALGMSQSLLAERAGTTPQNISKYEKDGLYDIRWIRLLSNILGQNLETDVIDEEGSVGEIGKEILYRLIEAGGYMHTEDLSANLYGLDDNRINKEISKLSRIGMIGREEIADWNEMEENILFITAKGLITLKNMTLNNKMQEYIMENESEIITYEMAKGEYDLYQDYINDNEAERIIRNFNYGLKKPWYMRQSEMDKKRDAIDPIITTDYRINYIVSA